MCACRNGFNYVYIDVLTSVGSTSPLRDVYVHPDGLPDDLHSVTALVVTEVEGGLLTNYGQYCNFIGLKHGRAVYDSYV